MIREILLSALPAGMLDRIRLQQDVDLWVDLIEPASCGAGCRDAPLRRRVALYPEWLLSLCHPDLHVRHSAHPRKTGLLDAYFYWERRAPLPQGGFRGLPASTPLIATSTENVGTPKRSLEL